jgi:uncharacterized protein (DUF1330 family)
MAAYLIFTRLRTKDQAELDKYFASGEASDDLPFTILVGYGKQEVLEGDSHEGMVVLEFENFQAARDGAVSPIAARLGSMKFTPCVGGVMLQATATRPGQPSGEL